MYKNSYLLLEIFNSWNAKAKFIQFNHIFPNVNISAASYRKVLDPHIRLGRAVAVGFCFLRVRVCYFIGFVVVIINMLFWLDATRALWTMVIEYTDIHFKI